MSPVVVEVGPRTVRGPDDAQAQWVSVAMECVDDRIAVLDGRLVEVAQLWCDVLGAVTGGSCGMLALVFPSWWSAGRIGVVTAAAREVSAEVVVLQRSAILCGESPCCIVELSEDFLVVTSSDSERAVLARQGADVSSHLDAGAAVLVDVPAGVAPLPRGDIAALRARGHPVAYSDRHRIARAVSAALTVPEHSDPSSPKRPHRQLLAVAAGATVTVAAVGGGWAAQALSGESPSAYRARLLVEGSVAVQIPAHWTVERLTAGPGSPRLRVAAPGGSSALHITQSTGTAATTLAEVAETLGNAFESAPDGIFVDFDPADDVGGRPAVTYRELRQGGDTMWAVVVDGTTRIAVGCQSAAARDEACVQAIRSARVVQ